MRLAAAFLVISSGIIGKSVMRCELKLWGTLECGVEKERLILSLTECRVSVVKHIFY